MQEALDNWRDVAPQLETACRRLDAGGWVTCEYFDPSTALAPLPRAYQWVDASVYRNHARLMYAWRQVPIPDGYETEPLVYQGGSDIMLSGTAPIEVTGDDHGADFEAEIAVVTTDVPMGATVEQARNAIALVVLLNDVSLRALIPGELARGFGFYQSKPATSFAPVAVTPGALGEMWANAMLHVPVRIELNGELFGTPDAGEDTAFNFAQIISHLAKTRALCAGTIVGAGTISNEDPATGSACVTEARVRQALAGVPESQQQPYLKSGDRVRIEVLNKNGGSVFGRIDQEVLVR
jgi:fumarylacetoacetate (FAA) hydrolase